jgi:hypothetical protein
MKISRLSIYLLLLTSCVSPYEIKPAQYHDGIVVEGLISDQPGPYVVKITKVSPITDYINQPEAVAGASIVIYDDEGTVETLTEKSPGNYYTNSIQGVIGRSYYITVATPDGSTYQSTPEKLTPVGDIKNVNYEFVQNEDPFKSRQITSKNGFNVYLDGEVLPSQEGRVWWRWNGTFHIFTYPKLKMKVVPKPGPPQEPPPMIPDPPACSGWLYYARSGFYQIGTCQCCDCWVTQYNQLPLLSDPALTKGNEINSQFVGFVEANVRTFYDKYYMQIDQLSVSQSMYDFWKRVKQEQSNSSNLFQTPPAKTGGNIIPTSIGATNVVGYFAASSMKTYILTLSRSDVPYGVQPIDTIADACTAPYKNSTTAKPIFW